MNNKKILIWFLPAIHFTFPFILAILKWIHMVLLSVPLLYRILLSRVYLTIWFDWIFFKSKKKRKNTTKKSWYWWRSFRQWKYHKICISCFNVAMRRNLLHFPYIFAYNLSFCCHSFLILFPFLMFIQQKHGQRNRWFFLHSECCVFNSLLFFLVWFELRINTDRIEIWNFVVIKIYLLAFSST